MVDRKMEKSGSVAGCGGFAQAEATPVKFILNPALTRPQSQKAIPRSSDLLWLDKNENLDPALLAINERILCDLPPLNLATYPEPAALYTKLASWLDVSPDGLILTPGSDGAIRRTFEVFVSAGDKVVHTLPTFAMYPVYCQMFGAQAEPIAYERGSCGPTLTVEKILAHLKSVKPRLFCLPNPDSPTGTVLSQDELRAIVALCVSLDTILLIDEAYHPFYVPTCVPWTRECRHLVVARTFAKAWGLAGLRIGYAVGHPDTIRYFHKMRPMYELGTLSIAFMERAMDQAGEMEASVKRLLEGKQYFADEMKGLGFQVPNTHGNFQHIGFGDRADVIHRKLESIVLYRKNFNENCLSGFSRFSSATRQSVEPVIQAIKQAVGTTY